MPLQLRLKGPTEGASCREEVTLVVTHSPGRGRASCVCSWGFIKGRDYVLKHNLGTWEVQEESFLFLTHSSSKAKGGYLAPASLRKRTCVKCPGKLRRLPANTRDC